MRKTGGLQSAVRKTKKLARRMKMMRAVSKNRKRLGHILKSVGQVVEKRL